MREYDSKVSGPRAFQAERRVSANVLSWSCAVSQGGQHGRSDRNEGKRNRRGIKGRSGERSRGADGVGLIGP